MRPSSAPSEGASSTTRCIRTAPCTHPMPSGHQPVSLSFKEFHHAPAHSGPCGRILVLLASGLVLFSACGGGGSGTSTPDIAAAASSITPELPTEQIQAYTVDSAELIRNGLFSEGLTGWNVNDAVLVSSALRPGAKALNVGWRAIRAVGGDRTGAAQVIHADGQGSQREPIRLPRLAVDFRLPTATKRFAPTRDGRLERLPGLPGSLHRAGIHRHGRRDVTPTAPRTVVDSVSLKMRRRSARPSRSRRRRARMCPPATALAFNDEFNGTALEPRQMVHALHLRRRERSTTCTTRNSATATTTTTRSPAACSASSRARFRAPIPNGVNYESGMIRSDWTSRYGFYEARVKMPGGHGRVAGASGSTPTSSAGQAGVAARDRHLRVRQQRRGGQAEHAALQRQDQTRGVHVSRSSTPTRPSTRRWSVYIAPFNFNDGWHTVGAEWDCPPGHVFIDGKKIYTRSYTWTYADGTPAGPAHILLNLAIGGDWAGRHGIDDTAFPAAVDGFGLSEGELRLTSLTRALVATVGALRSRPDLVAALPCGAARRAHSRRGKAPRVVMLARSELALRHEQRQHHQPHALPRRCRARCRALRYVAIDTTQRTPAPFGAQLDLVDAGERVDLEGGDTISASSGLRTATPISVLMYAERGSRFIEPRAPFAVERRLRVQPTRGAAEAGRDRCGRASGASSSTSYRSHAHPQQLARGSARRPMLTSGSSLAASELVTTRDPTPRSRSSRRRSTPSSPGNEIGRDQDDLGARVAQQLHEAVGHPCLGRASRCGQRSCRGRVGDGACAARRTGCSGARASRCRAVARPNMSAPVSARAPGPRRP